MAREAQNDKEQIAGEETIKGLTVLIEATASFHFQLQVITDELHGRSEVSRACRGILQELYRRGPRTVPQLTRGRSVSRQNVLMLVNRLIADGMAELTHNPEHKRSQLVRLTARGKTLLEEMWGRETAFLHSLDLHIPIDDLRTATTVLHQLQEAFEQHRMYQRNVGS